jgi:DedD protein
MASQASPEASEVRRRGQRRLIGAVAIVLLLVVFVPMLLDSEPRLASKGPDLTIPPRHNAPALPPPVAPSPKMAEALPKTGKGEPSPRPSPKGEGETPPKPQADVGKVVPEATKAAAEAQVAVVEPDAAAKKAELLKQGSSPKAEGATPPAKPDSPQPPAKTAPTPRLEGFAIQVGAFRDEDKLRVAREKLAAAGVVHYTERLESPGGPLTRLRAGPFPTRAAADATAGKIKGIAPDAKVVPLP